jgi:phospholipid/cholesterol/gamma-HCH transport system substrate-binding protein
VREEQLEDDPLCAEIREVQLTMRRSSAVGRAAGMAAIVVAIVAIAVIVTSGGSHYKIKAVFQDASQIVGGDTVQVSGNVVGTVSDISLTPDGQAQMTLDITDGNFQHLHRGTVATVRASSLSGIANRYIDLRLGPASSPEIPNGGTINSDSTTSAVDLDELFNTLDAPTRKGLQDFIQGSASSYAGNGAAAQAGWRYLNPSIASTSALFAELNRDTSKFTGFIVKTGNLVSDIAQRQADLSALIQHLNGTTTALANQHVALGQAIRELPGFMRLANTTFVNLRSALDALKPLVEASKPVTPKLQKLLEQLKPLAQEAVPTVRDLANIVSRPGPDNDLIELTRLGVPLAAVTVHSVTANGARRPSAFKASVLSLSASTPELAVARPYAADLTGWFEGFTHPGVIDANGGTSRVAPVIGAFGSGQSGTLNFLQPAERLLVALTGQNHVLVSGYGDRCPGSMERGGTFYPETGYPCDPTQVPTSK